MVANGSDEAKEVILSVIKDKHNISSHIGIHFNLTEGMPVTESIKKCKRIVNPSTGEFRNSFPYTKSYATILSKREKDAIYEELCGQVMILNNMGIYITHADSHQHIHYNPCILPIVISVCKKFNIKTIRIHKNIKKDRLIKRIYRYFYNHFFIQTNGYNVLVDWFGNALEIESIRGGVTEVMVHPDYDDSHKLINRIKKEKVNDKITNIGNDLYDDLRFLKKDFVTKINY
jgi:hypothetical protein